MCVCTMRTLAHNMQQFHERAAVFQAALHIAWFEGVRGAIVYMLCTQSPTLQDWQAQPEIAQIYYVFDFKLILGCAFRNFSLLSFLL